jgi:hypothetical protein
MRHPLCLTTVAHSSCESNGSRRQRYSVAQPTEQQLMTGLRVMHGALRLASSTIRRLKAGQRVDVNPLLAKFGRLLAESREVIEEKSGRPARFH